MKSIGVVPKIMKVPCAASQDLNFLSRAHTCRGEKSALIEDKLLDYSTNRNYRNLSLLLEPLAATMTLMSLVIFMLAGKVY